MPWRQPPCGSRICGLETGVCNVCLGTENPVLRRVHILRAKKKKMRKQSSDHCSIGLRFPHREFEQRRFRSQPQVLHEEREFFEAVISSYSERNFIIFIFAPGK